MGEARDGVIARNRKATTWETLNESVHHMANMDLRTGNKGQVVSMPMEGLGDIMGPWSPGLQSRSQVSFPYIKRGRLGEGYLEIR